MTHSLLLETSPATELQAQPSDPDRHAVELALADPAEFAILYRRYAVDVFRYCARRTDDREAAEDLTSQVFMRALSMLSSLGDRPFRPWLFAIAHNLVIDSWRSHKVTVPIEQLTNIAGGESSPEQVALHQERSSEIHTLLRGLPERERQVVELRLAGLAGQEIAEVLGCSQPAVRAAHHRAIEHLRTALANPGTDWRAE
jgi:RNA polymerase sigma-70 factor (ECF subfamily)